MTEAETFYYFLGLIIGVGIGLFGMWNVGMRDFKRIRK